MRCKKDKRKGALYGSLVLSLNSLADISARKWEIPNTHGWRKTKLYLNLLKPVGNNVRQAIR